MSVNTETISSDEAFEQAVWDAPHICNTCFSLLRDGSALREGEHGHDKVVHASRMTTVRSHDRPQHVEGPRGQIVEYTRVENPEIATYPARTTCGNCGSIAGRAPETRVSPKHWVEHSDKLCERLREAGFEVVDYKLRRSIRLMYDGRPEIQGYPPRDVLASAVDIAIEHSR